EGVLHRLYSAAPAFTSAYSHSLRDALPIYVVDQLQEAEGIATIASDQPLAAVTLRQNDDGAIDFPAEVPTLTTFPVISGRADARSEEHTSELQSREKLVCRLLLERTKETYR